MFFYKELPTWWWFVVPLWPIWVLVLWAIWKIARDRRDAQSVEHAAGWPEVQGKIISSKVVWAHVEVAYEYWVFTERHEGIHKIALMPVPVGGTGLQSARAARRR
jgi:hypothetical protein